MEDETHSDILRRVKNLLESKHYPEEMKDLLALLDPPRRFQLYNFINDASIEADELSTPGHSKLLSPPPLLQERFFSLVRTIEDAERKCTLLLAWFGIYPYFQTPCCQAKLCFKCKTSEWHHGIFLLFCRAVSFRILGATTLVSRTSG